MPNPNSFDYANTGPFGICLNQQLQQTFDQNVAFSESAWENAKQNCTYGCVLPPGIPVWPPGVTPLSGTIASGVVPLTDPQLVQTLQSKPYQFDSPFVVKNEYKHFVSNNSPAIQQSLENGCGVKIPAQIVAKRQSLSEVEKFNPATEIKREEQKGACVSASSSSTSSPNVLTSFFRSLVEAFRGVDYDAKNWQQLPGETTGQKLQFMATHDPDRVWIIVLAVVLGLAILSMIVLLPVSACCKRC